MLLFLDHQVYKITSYDCGSQNGISIQAVSIITWEVVRKANSEVTPQM